MARPRLKIDPAQVEQLAAIGCSGEEIAAVIGCSRETIYARFSDTLIKGRERLKASLKRSQYEAAIKNKNVAMLIWLGKQYLDQHDKIDYTHISDEDLISEAKRHFGGAFTEAVLRPVGSSPHEP